LASKADTFSVRLPDDLKAGVAQLAALTKRSRAFIVKEAVAAYVEEHRAYLEAVDEALAEADKGVFVSGDAVFAWLGSLGMANERPMPEPDIFPDKAK
jgi:predicted transcriptional regulator